MRGGPNGPMGPGGNGPMWRGGAEEDDTPLTEQEEAEAFDYLRDTQPEFYELAKKVREGSGDPPERYNRMLRRALRDKRRMEFLKEHDPERYEEVQQERELHRRIQTLKKEYRNADEGKAKEAIREELREVLEKEFELRTARPEQEIEDLEQRLETQKENLVERKKNADTIIEQQLRRTFEEGSYMDW